MYRIVVLFSGDGNTMQSIIDNTGHTYEVAACVTNNPNADGIQRAISADIPLTIVDHRPYDREEFDMHLVSCIEYYQPDLVVLAGFMRILTDIFTEQFDGRCVNIHPSLLPRYPGLNTYQRALDSGDSHAGFTIHHVITKLDAGPTIYQHSVPIMEGDTPTTLRTRVQEQERIWYPKIIEVMAKEFYASPC